MALGNVSRVAVATLLTLVAVMNARASHEAEHGADLSVSLQGSANAIGAVNRLDTSIGYRFNRFVGLSLGIPVYFVKPSDSTIQTNGTDSTSGLGNVYASLRLTLDRSTFLFTSVVTRTAPTGDKVKGLSTGRGGNPGNPGGGNPENPGPPENSPQG